MQIVHIFPITKAQPNAIGIQTYMKTIVVGKQNFRLIIDFALPKYRQRKNTEHENTLYYNSKKMYKYRVLIFLRCQFVLCLILLDMQDMDQLFYMQKQEPPMQLRQLKRFLIFSYKYILVQFNVQK